MVRHYKRKTARKVTSPNKLERAYKLVKQSGWTIRGAARQENVKKSCLWEFCKKMEKHDSNNNNSMSFKLSHASRSIFTHEQEEAIASYCILVAKMGYGLTVNKVRELAFEVALKNNITVLCKWSDEKLAGIEWFNGFKKRHSGKLSLRTPEACSLARAMAFNKPTVEKYFEKREEVLNRHESFRSGPRVFNLDETSTSTVQNTSRIISPKGSKQVHVVKTAERGVSVTTTVIIGAHSMILPPAMIFPRKVFQSHMLSNAFPGTLGLANASGYNTKETFVDIIGHFIRCTNSSKQNPTLLLMDNVETHFCTECLDLAKENGVVIFTFPPHCTHKLQPLDVGFFGPFKRYNDSSIHSFILNNPGVPTTIYNIAGFVREAMMKAGTPSIIINSFQKPGIIPYNSNVFEESDFLVASVTFHPDPSAEQTINHPAEEQPPVNPPEINLPPQPSADVNGNRFIGPEDIRGLPHAKPTVTKRKLRKKGKSIVATDTPEKQAITEREQEVRAKKQKAEENQKKKSETKAGKGKNCKKSNGRVAKVAKALTYDTSSEDSDVISETVDNV